MQGLSCVSGLREQRRFGFIKGSSYNRCTPDVIRSENNRRKFYPGVGSAWEFFSCIDTGAELGPWR